MYNPWKCHHRHFRASALETASKMGTILVLDIVASPIPTEEQTHKGSPSSESGTGGENPPCSSFLLPSGAAQRRAATKRENTMRTRGNYAQPRWAVLPSSISKC